MRTEDLEKAYPHVDDEGRRYRLIGGGAAAPRDYYVPGAPLPPPASAIAARTDEAGAAAVPSTRENLLIQLKELLWLETLSQLGAAIPDTSRPTCFISYAWGNEATEECVHKLAIDLKCAGIDIVIDVIHNRDDSIAAFKEQILKTDTVLVMGTPELKYKWEKRIGHVVPQELDLIDDRTRSRAPHQVIRALLRASPDASFPDFMKLILPLVDLTLDISIEEEILKLLNFLYLAKAHDAKEPHCLKLQEEAKRWNKLKTELAALSKAELETQLKAYTEKHGEALKTKKGLKEHYAAEAAITRRLRATQEARAELSPWDPPHANRYFTGRESQLTELAKALQAKQSGVIAQMVAGLGGVGKTTLAIEYAERAKNKRMQGDVQLNYDKIFWINVQSPSFSLRALARALNLPVDDYKDDSDLMHIFYAHVVDHYSRCLLILDDVENYAAIKQYLPQTSYDSIHILMTSRSREWTATPIHPILLDGFTRTESIDYIHQWLPSESKEAKALLAALLYDFPLALSQALAYINQYKLSIEDYIASYQTHEKIQQELLEHEAPILSGELKENAKKRAVYTTWHLSIEKLRSDPTSKTAGELAEKLLSLSAYLLSHDIPIAFLEKLLGCNRLELGAALNLLSQHSLIQLDGSESYGMHQLLQEVIRLHEYKREESLILALIAQFETELKPDAYEVIKEQEGLFRHLDHLLTYVMNKESLSYLLGSFFLIIERVAKIHARLGSCETLLKAKAYYEFLLKSNKEKTGSDEEIGSVWILGNLALVFDALGDVEKKKELLEKVLRIQIAHYKTEEHVEVARTLANLAIAAGALGDVEKKKELLEKALRIQIAHYKTEEHVEVARTLHGLANAVGALGNVVKKKVLLEKALWIMIAHYKTEEHAEVAIIQFNLAQSYSSLKDYTAALNLMSKAYGGFSRGYGESHPHTQLAKEEVVKLSSLISSAAAQGGAGFLASNAMKAPTLLNAAHAALTEGNIVAAIHHYGASIELEPESVSAHYHLGCCYHIQAALNGNQADLLAKAEGHFIQAYGIEAHSSICVEYANFLCRLGRFADAIPCLEMATSEAVHNDGKKLSYMPIDKILVPKVIRVEIEKFGEVSLVAVELGYFLLVQAYLRTEQREKAQAAALALNQRVAESEHALSYCLVGYVYKLLGKYEMAANYFALASNLRESYILAKENLKECLDKMALGALTTAGLFASSAAAGGGGGAAGAAAAAAASLAASSPTVASDSEGVKPH